MRTIILDTETPGLDPKLGHRVIEIAGVEVVDRRLTGRHIHFYLDPEREIDAAATEVHGHTWETLRDKPKFADVIAEFLDFASGARWVIHNAPFDLAFLDEELKRLELPSTAAVCVEIVDTLELAREQFPGKRKALDALCERFGIDNAQRTLHSALLDARLLAEVYLAMTRGQESLSIELAPPVPAAMGAADLAALAAIRVLAPSAEELAAHQAYLAELDREAKGRCLWLALEREAAGTRETAAA